MCEFSEIILTDLIVYIGALTLFNRCFYNLASIFITKVFLRCRALTDISLKFVGKNCSGLRTLDLSYLHNLTDLSMRYLADGCQLINRLKLCRNGFRFPSIAISSVHFLASLANDIFIVILCFISFSHV